MTTLREATAALHRAEMDELGDEITYTPGGGGPSTFNAWVEFNNDQVATPGSSTTVHSRLVEVLKADVPAPARGDAVTIGILPGQAFVVADVQDGETGATWRLPLKRKTVAADA